MDKIENVFRGLGRTEKVKFISANVDSYANAESIARYVEGYLFDVLEDVGDDDSIAFYLEQKGYQVKKEDK